MKADHRHLIVMALVAALAAMPSVPVSGAAEQSRPVACSWTPAADVLAFGPALVGTVRMVGTDVEVLHRVSCSDQTERWLWMPARTAGRSRTLSLRRQP